MKSLILIILLFIFDISQLCAAESLSYSGRLVNANGSPVTGNVNLLFELGYTTATPPIITSCSQTISNVPLTNGVFHVKLDPTCSGGLTLSQIILATPLGESLAIRVTDQTHTKTYSYQALYSMPVSLVAKMAKQLEQMGASNGQILAWDGTKWAPTNAGAGSGTVTSITAGTGLSATATNPITSSGTISIANGGVNTAQLADSAVSTLKIADGALTDVKVSATAGIARTKLASGTANAVIVNNGSGVMSEVATLPLAQGGTGASTQSGARAALGLGTAAVVDLGYAAGNVLPSDNIPVCLPTQKLLFTGVGPTYWSCASDIDTTADNTKLPIDGSVAMTGVLDMGNHKVVNVTSPTVAGDAANKAYVDAEIADAIAAVPTSVWSSSAPDIYFNTGKVGIGTNAPTSDLDVKSTNVSASSFRVTNTDSTNGDSQVIVKGMSGNPVIETQRWTGSGTNYNAARIITNSSGGIQFQNTFITSPGGAAIGSQMFTDTVSVDPTGALSIRDRLRLKSDNANYVEIRSPAALGATLTFTMPGGYGSSGNALTTDGAGNLSWSAVTTSSSSLSGDVTGTLTSTSLANNTVTSAKIVDGTITGSDIADSTIPYAKLNIADADIPLAKINGLVAALAGKESSISAGTNSQYWRGDKTWQTLDTSVVPENGNLYFLDSRVRAALMSGYSMGTALPIAATDTLMEALGKLEASVASVQAGGQWNTSNGNVFRTSGNVGIGTNTPVEKLSVNGVVRAGNAASTAGALMLVDNYNGVGNLTTFGTEYSSGGPSIGYAVSPSTTNPGQFVSSYPALASRSALNMSGDFRFYMGDAQSPAIGSAPTMREVMRIHSTGNVGIGTNNPLALLEIAAGTGNAHIRIGDRDHNESPSSFEYPAISYHARRDNTRGNVTSQITFIDRPGTSGFPNAARTSDVAIQTAHNWNGTSYGQYLDNTLYLRADQSGGSVGIGTNTPSAKLQVQGRSIIGDTSSTSVGGRVLQLYTGNTSNANAGLDITRGDNNSYGIAGSQLSLRIKSDGTGFYRGAIGFADSDTPSEAITLLANGRIGIGVIAPTTALEVNGTVKATAFEGPMTSTTVTTSSGSAAAPSYSFSSDSNSGFYSAGSGSIGVSSGGSQIFTFGSDGLTSPTTGGGSVSTANGTASAPTFSFSGDSDTGWFRPLADTLAAATGGLERMRIAANGMVTVGNENNLVNGDLLRIEQAFSNTSYTNAQFSMGVGGQPHARFVAGSSGGSGNNNPGFLDIYTTDNSAVPQRRMRFDNAGNVGIGKTNLSATLDVAGKGRFETADPAVLKLIGSGAGYADGNDGVLSVFSENTIGSGGNLIKAGSTFVPNAFILKDTGHVTIGGATPLERLDVRGGIRGDVGIYSGATSSGLSSFGLNRNSQNGGVIYPTRKGYGIEANSAYSGNDALALVEFNSLDQGSLLYRASSTEHRWLTGNAERMRIDSSGLHTNAKAHIDSGRLIINRVRDVEGGGEENDYAYITASNAYHAGLNFQTTYNGTANTHMTINREGFVGIGTAVPSEKLQVNGRVKAFSYRADQGYPAGADSSVTGYSFGDDGDTGVFSPTDAGGGAANGILSLYANGLEHIRMMNGVVGIGMTSNGEKLEVNGNVKATSFLYTSDRRLKSNIQDISSPMEKIKNLRGVNFTWKTSGRKDVGFIAQEVEKVLPDLVKTDKKNGYKSVQYSNIIAVLVEAFKDHFDVTAKENEKLKREIANLKQNNELMNKRLEALEKAIKK